MEVTGAGLLLLPVRKEDFKLFFFLSFSDGAS